MNAILNKSRLVKSTSQYVMKHASHVTINQGKIPELALKFQARKKFNQFDCHDVKQSDEQILMYLFILDSCNFCFWPLEGFEYQNLANHIKKYVQSGQAKLDFLTQITQNQLVKIIFSDVKIPLADQRARILRQMSTIVMKKYNGSFSNIIKQADKSAVNLLNIFTSNFPNFQDHSIYKGHQVHFYKRGQILIADIWGKFQGKGLGQFKDIEELTMFPDYRVPQILNQYGILTYSQSLNKKIQNKEQIHSGSQEQIQIRASTIIAVQKMKNHLNEKEQYKGSVISIDCDWFLWQLGQSMLDKIVPHHRTLTIYY